MNRIYGLYPRQWGAVILAAIMGLFYWVNGIHARYEHQMQARIHQLEAAQGVE